jgi:O-acetyl-ADP-ribose deacetylase (regulator of RNase III)
MNRLVNDCTLPTGQQLELVQGDLTEEQVDAIVNAANAQLRHGGGVAGAIIRRGGRQIQIESNVWIREHGPVHHDRPAITGAGSLPCQYVIHAVGPVWGDGDEDAKLSAAVRGSLEIADQAGLASIALPAISTGIFGFPRRRAARIILGTIRDYFLELGQSNSSTIRQIRLVLYERAALDDFATVWQENDPCRPTGDSA